MTAQMAQARQQSVRVACREITDLAYRIGCIAGMGSGTAASMAKLVFYAELHHRSGLRSLADMSGQRAPAGIVSDLPLAALESGFVNITPTPTCVLRYGTDLLDLLCYLAQRFGFGWLAMNDGMVDMDILEAILARGAQRQFIGLAFQMARSHLCVAYVASDGVGIARGAGVGRKLIQSLSKHLSLPGGKSRGGTQLVLMSHTDYSVQVMDDALGAKRQTLKIDTPASRVGRASEAQREGIAVDAALWFELDARARQFLVPEAVR